MNLKCFFGLHNYELLRFWKGETKTNKPWGIQIYECKNCGKQCNLMLVKYDDDPGYKTRKLSPSLVLMYIASYRTKLVYEKNVTIS